MSLVAGSYHLHPARARGRPEDDPITSPAQTAADLLPLAADSQKVGPEQGR
jgi:hypothetical protein